MRTFEGCGTKHMGVTEGDEPGTHYATVWIVLLGLPLIPLRRQKVAFGRAEHRGFASLSSVQEFTILGRLPLSLGNILRTYALTWLVFVPLLLGPLALAILATAEVIRWEWLKRGVEKGWFFVLNTVWIIAVIVGERIINRKDPTAP